MNIKLLTENHLEFQSLKIVCRGLSESTLVKLPHCWKSHVAAQNFVVQSIPFQPSELVEQVSDPFHVSLIQFDQPIRDNKIRLVMRFFFSDKKKYLKSTIESPLS